MLKVFGLAASIIFAAGSTFAQVGPVRIVALGASQIACYGVGQGAAAPALLERKLRSDGYNVEIVNAGVSGDTSADVLARINSAVPQSTSIVILGGFVFNDRRRGMSQSQTNANTSAIVRYLKSRRIRVLNVISGGIPRRYFQSDGIHLTAEGHAVWAARIYPRLVGLLGRRR